MALFSFFTTLLIVIGSLGIFFVESNRYLTGHTMELTYYLLNP
jgi:hypothetical protein